jgi:hypothetical protein
VRYSLDHVRRIVFRGGDSIWFSAPSRSFLAVVKVYQDSLRPLSLEEARKFILRALLELKEADFE